MFLRYAKLYLIALAVFLVIDLLWLGVVAVPFYAAQAGHLMAPTPNWLGVGVFYLVYVLGLLLWVIVPGLSQPAWRQRLLRAAAFGFITYATYDLTNWATLRDWPVLLTVVDIAWGVGLNVVTSAVVWGVIERFKVQGSRFKNKA